MDISDRQLLLNCVLVASDSVCMSVHGTHTLSLRVSDHACCGVSGAHCGHSRLRHTLCSALFNSQPKSTLQQLFPTHHFQWRCDSLQWVCPVGDFPWLLVNSCSPSARAFFSHLQRSRDSTYVTELHTRRWPQVQNRCGPWITLHQGATA